MTLLASLVLIVVVLILFYKWSTAKFNILRERNVAHFKPQPFFGNFAANVLLGKSSLAKLLIELQLKFRNSKVYGIYIMRDPLIFVQDANLIKKVCIKDFYNFTNHKSMTLGEIDFGFGRNLYFLRDHEWSEMRDILAPTFTDIKMRAMFELMDECCIDGINYLDGKITENGSQGLELKMEDIFSRFTNDVILSTVLGIKAVSFRQKENCFFKIGSVFMNFSATQMLKSYLVETMPGVMRFLGKQFYDAESLKYFNSLVKSTIRYRESHNIVRPDMIHLLMEAKKLKTSKYLQLDDNDIVAQCMLFFFAGFGKVAHCLCFTAHELMENPDVQEKLLKEIQQVQGKLHGKPLNYDTLIHMKYMDMVILESLRKWPPVVLTNRICSQDYDLLDDDGNIVVRLKKNDEIGISILGLHRDPEYFENPEMFIPERFSEENKINIRPFTYLPFGVGPRMCPGNRFVLLEIKAILYHVLLRYKIVSSSNTKSNIIETLQGFQHIPQTYWLRLLPRNYSL